MAKYATIVDGAIYKIQELTPEQIADIPPHKASYILPVISETVDNSTPDAETVSELTTNKEIQADRVYSLRTIRDKTAQEIQAEIDGIVDQWDNSSRDDRYALIAFVKDLTAYTFELTNTVRVNNGDAPITLNTFANQIVANSNKVSMSQFKTFARRNIPGAT